VSFARREALCGAGLAAGFFFIENADMDVSCCEWDVAEFAPFVTGFH
jgi:hypothetical protein